MAQTRPPAYYDFSPFQQAPGVAAQIRKYGAPQIVDIPQTTIPSPLAPDLSPDTVAGLKRRLLGDGSVKGALRGRGAGGEVWASWKRAWDLWNNYYIEGRVSPVWIRKEYERLKKEMGDAREQRRREQDMKRFRTWNSPQRRNKPAARATIFSQKQPQAAPGKVYRQTSETRPAKNSIVKKMQSRPKTGSTRVYKRKGEKVPVYGERAVTEIVQIERVVPRDPVPVSSWTDVVADSKTNLPLPPGNPGPESIETVTEITLEERPVMEFSHIDVFGEKVSPKAMSSSEVKNYLKDNGTLPSLDDEEEDVTSKFVSQRPQMWHPVTEPCLEGERVLTNDETVFEVEFEDRLVDVLEDDDNAVLIGWAEEDENPAVESDEDEGSDVDLDLGFDVDGDNHFARMPMPLVDEEPAVFYKPRNLVESEDHFGGGFYPMKYLDPYPEPDDFDGDGDPDWFDALQNTVWCPRIVGEKTLRIELDDQFDVFTAKKWLEVDGGVDCGRSPYPVLRSVTEYVKIPKDLGGDLNGVFRKKKMWDGVTGTIFNMPTKPLEQDETEDERVSRMQVLYGDSFRDNRNKHRHEFFPLDIRRVKRRSDHNYPGRQFSTPVLGNNETLIRYPWHIPEDDGKDLPVNDPWAVTAEQKRKRDVPIRRYPPPRCCRDENRLDVLPVDDSIWREEVEDDDYGRWKYFVTNLHGGTLLINGKEIKKNQIAGPLPEFAVIECPGKQIAFWWGPGGRNYLQGQPGYDHERRWESLRHSDPDLAKFALSAGQEWDYKIRVRITKEFTGNEWEDDAQWEEWKKAVGELEPNPKCDPATHAPTDNALIRLKKFNKVGTPTGTDIVQPECFQSDRDELRWLHTKAEPLAKVIKSAQKDTFIEPFQVGKLFFPGSVAQSDAQEVRAQRMALRAYTAKERDIIREQMKLNAAVAMLKAAKLEREREAKRAIGRKRAAESQLQSPFPKKNFVDLTSDVSDAEDDLPRYVEREAEHERSEVPQSLEYLVRVFDKDIKSALERRRMEYSRRRSAAVRARREFTELEPSLEAEVEHYLNKRKEKEKEDLQVLERFRASRLAAGNPLPPDSHLPPSLDQIYAAWKEYQAQLARESEWNEAEERRIEEARLEINQAAEQERLRHAEIKAAEEDEEVAYKRAAEQQQRNSEQMVPEKASLTPAELAQEKRLANLRAIIANNKAKRAGNSGGMNASLQGSALHRGFGHVTKANVDAGKDVHPIGDSKAADGQARRAGGGSGVNNKGRRRGRGKVGETEGFEMMAEGLERTGAAKVDVYREFEKEREGDTDRKVSLTL